MFPMAPAVTRPNPACKNGSPSRRRFHQEATTRARTAIGAQRSSHVFDG